jgi:hypothetical protein
MEDVIELRRWWGDMSVWWGWVDVLVGGLRQAFVRVETLADSSCWHCEDYLQA